MEQSDDVVTISVDEKTGIQAKQNIKITTAKSGQVKRVDPEYKRNGTTCLIAGMNIMDGEVTKYQLGQTRNEEDFCKFIESIIDKYPNKKIVFVADQLNTHKSESLVKLIADKINYDSDLGKKGRCGILKTMKSRMEFLEDKDHKIRFQYTPKHCSWLNQIENWFGRLQKHVIRNGQFNSVANLERKITNYIEYYNERWKKPIEWCFGGF
ncbi:transposase [Persicobacter psychrovividus]|uniref:Tc1-like transposase DDE domain-containing protein n=2 Tax=Persicobacter psychrovividus TaxID=387638 RepID=A0ABM7VHS3_9BACT|nr:hypothetical protein PEPS_28120 [Persicobacter psychrovividus]BDD00536.1 hypothetical protein PEPS_28160 [Persicobacter psychrovividus]BDD01315.1 hypothetical protein PEPS_35950 [Persicobacter psychrovividus]BDD01396.1 hypothetical protein PEPS_36760 [Persicobacter psychrovividus]